MDKSHTSPRLSVYQRSVSSSATAYGNTALVSTDMPLAPTRPFGAARPGFIPVDFTTGAKAYKRSRLKRRAIKIVLIFGIMLLLIAAALGSVGYALNKHYAGKALPYTYVGNISVGGLTQPEIKLLLDKRVKDVRITLKEGGLERNVSASVFGAQFDTEAASHISIADFNPFSYLQKREFVVPVEVNDRYVDGYIRLNVADKQTDSENAEIIKTKKELQIVPELYGFRTSTAYVVDQLKEQLPTLEDPVIDLTAAVDRPTITKDDLQDDLDTAKRLIATDVGVQIYNTVTKPTEDQKLSWLEIKEVPGTSGVQVQYSSAKVREYVFELAKKYNTEPVNEQIITNPDKTQTIVAGKNGSKVENIDDVATNFFKALSNQQAGVFSFTITPVDYTKVDPALITNPVVVSKPTTNSTAPEQTTTDQTQQAITTESTQQSTPRTPRANGVGNN